MATDQPDVYACGDIVEFPLFTVGLKNANVQHWQMAHAHGKLDWPRGYKTCFVLNTVEHEILNAHKYKNIKKFGLFNAQLSLECHFSRSYMLKCQQLLAF